jgi:putative ABC transport system substrate-binding protein
MDVELVTVEGGTPEELDAITSAIPEDIDAVFRVRSGSIGARIGQLVQAANARRIPVFSSDIGSLISEGVMMGYGPNYAEMGKQAARMVDQILDGAAPSSLPVENSEVFLGINMQTAQTIGIEIPDSILRNAQQLIRP